MHIVHHSEDHRSSRRDCASADTLSETPGTGPAHCAGLVPSPLDAALVGDPTGVFSSDCEMPMSLARSDSSVMLPAGRVACASDAKGAHGEGQPWRVGVGGACVAQGAFLSPSRQPNEINTPHSAEKDRTRRANASRGGARAPGVKKKHYATPPVNVCPLTPKRGTAPAPRRAGLASLVGRLYSDTRAPRAPGAPACARQAAPLTSMQQVCARHHGVRLLPPRRPSRGLLRRPPSSRENRAGAACSACEGGAGRRSGLRAGLSLL